MAKPRTKSPETVQQVAGGWIYRNPITNTWNLGEHFKTRKEAREARHARAQAGSFSNRPADSSCNTPSEEVSSSGIVNPGNEETQAEGDPKMTTLTKARTNKGGTTLYTIPGLNGSVKFSKSLFQGDAPETIAVSLPDGVLAQAGAVKAKVTTEEQAAKIRANAEKAKVRAEKAAARAAKAAARVEALAKVSA